MLTSQGIPFIFAGEEVMRDKKGVHNSYCSPDDVNAIDWSLKAKNRDLFDYYAALIALRKAHPALHLGDAEAVRKHLEFLDTEDCVVAFRLKNHAGKDEAKDIVVVLNANRKAVTVPLPEDNTYAAYIENGARVQPDASNYQGEVTVAPQTASILIAQ